VIDAPDGANPDDYAFQGQGTGLFSFFAPLAGSYTVLLTVENDQGEESEDTSASRVTFEAVPSDRFLVELTWDKANDQDLHLVNLSVSEVLCSSDDTYYNNMTPVWYASDPEGEGANPALDIDDIDGEGPENINIDAPKAATYRIYVHHYSSFDGPTTNTVKIWVDGEVAATYSRRFDSAEVWAVAEIDWAAVGAATITPYPSDAAGQTGAVAYMGDTCLDEFTFPD
jgi:uncharacterized protein YfaP (DUF2135 family)